MDRVKPAYRLREEPLKKPDRRNLLLALGGITGGIVVTGGAWLMSGQGRARASTRVGDRQGLTLPAGMRADLNTGSEVQWKAGGKTVDVCLRRGEVALVSGQLPARLFAANAIVTLVKGRVNAPLRGDLLDLAVISGDCTVQDKSAAAGDRMTSLGVNQGVLAGRGRQVVRSLNDADVRFISAWPQDELVFEGQTLGTAVGEYNRYPTQKLVIADPSLSDVRLGGRFTTHDPGPFLAALHSAFGINAIDDGAGTIALSR